MLLANGENNVKSSSNTSKLIVLFDQILIDFKVLKNSTHNQTSTLYLMLTNQIERLNTFLLNFTGKQRPLNSSINSSRFKNSPDTGFSTPSSSAENQNRVQNIEETEFIHKNNEVNQYF